MENANHSESHGAILIPAEDLGWVRQNDECETAVLLGNPDTSGGLYVMRYRVLVGCDISAHWHPEDEHVTVIAGEVSLGFGKKFSADVLRPLESARRQACCRGDVRAARAVDC